MRTTPEKIRDSIEIYRDSEVRKAIHSTTIGYHLRIRHQKMHIHVYPENDAERVYPNKGTNIAFDELFDEHWLNGIDSSYDEIEQALNSMERLVSRLRREVEVEVEVEKNAKLHRRKNGTED